MVSNRLSTERSQVQRPVRTGRFKIQTTLVLSGELSFKMSTLTSQFNYEDEAQG